MRLECLTESVKNAASFIESSTAPVTTNQCIELSCGDYGSSDFNAYGLVNIKDIMMMMTCDNCTSNCESDLNYDGIVNIDDVFAIFAVDEND